MKDRLKKKIAKQESLTWEKQIENAAKYILKNFFKKNERLINIQAICDKIKETAEFEAIVKTS